jgi:hypothetical protein
METPWRKWEDNINIDFKERGCEDMDSIKLPRAGLQWQDRVSSVIILRAGNFLTN